jgi:hypothetical protein
MNISTACGKSTRRYPGRVATAAIAASLLISAPALAQVAPPPSSTDPFAIAASTFTNGPNVGAQTAITGQVCYTTPPVTPPISISGGPPTVPCPPSVGTDELAALAILNGQPCQLLPGGPLEGVAMNGNPPGTFTPGCYFQAGALDITANGIVTLTGNGVFIFRSTGGALTTGANSQVVLTGGACAGNVYWAPVGATTLGANAAATAIPTFQGNILDNAGITIGNFANLNGRALAFAGTVTTAAVTITVPTACAALGNPVPPAPTLNQWGMIILAALLAIVGWAAMRRRIG